MGILDSLKKYAGKYESAGISNFSAEELATIKSTEICVSDFGLSMKLTLNSGEYSFIAVSNDATYNVGDVLVPSEVRIIKLKRDGDPKPIFRVL